VPKDGLDRPVFAHGYQQGEVVCGRRGTMGDIQGLSRQVSSYEWHSGGAKLTRSLVE
jgi:hypothetical protein